MSEKTSRREFFARGARTAALFGIGGIGGAGVGAGSAKAAGIEVSRYREVGSFETGARKARGIAAGAGGAIYVAADRGVIVFGRDGAERMRISVMGDAICVAERGAEILVGLKDHIEVFDAAGGRVATWASLGENASVTCLAVTGSGKVYVSDSGQRVVWHLDRGGEVLKKIERGDGAFAVPNEFFPIAAAGENVVVGNLGRHRVETYSGAGERVAEWGERTRGIEGFGGCCNPVSLAVTSDGHFVTAEGGLPRVKVFDAEGKFVEIVAGPDELEEAARGSHENTPELSEGCQSGGLEVAVDGERILVLDRVSASVKVFAVS